MEETYHVLVPPLILMI